MPQQNELLPKLKAYAQEAAQTIDTIIQADLNSALQSCDPLLKETISYAILGGGKRIRPLLAILSSRLCGRNDADLFLLAIAFEYLHVASLVHDDLIDNAKQRRGKPSLAQQYGKTAALLTGDWMLSRSMFLIGKLTGEMGLAIFCQATEGMVDGEFLQYRNIGRPETNEDEYFQVVQRKTGNLIASTCAIGALYGGADTTEQAALNEYGQSIGTAFQIIDDILDYEGDETATGKAVGNDFVEGKITLPLIHTLAAAEPEDHTLLEQKIIGNRNDPQAYLQVKELIGRYDGFGSAFSAAQQLIEQAHNSLALFSKSEDQESLFLLKALTTYILKRKQ